MRLYAEDPLRQFQPSPGVLTEVYFPEGPRVDGWVATGTEVPAYYDPMLAKLIVHGDTRETALARLSDALARTRLHGIATNLDYLRQIVADALRGGEPSTRFLETFEYRPAAIEVLEAGTYTSVQDYPGRAGYGISACRRPVRWTITRSGWPTASSATRRTPPASRPRWPALRCAFMATPSSR